MRMSYRKMNNLFPGMLALFVAVLILFFSQPVRAQWNFDDGTKQGWAGGGGRFDEFFWCWDDYVSYPYFPYDDVGNSHGSISFQLHATPEEPLANPSQDYHLKMYSPYFGNTEWDNAIGFTAKFLWLGNFNQTFHLNSNIRPEIYYIDQNGVKRELGGISDPSNTVWYDIESYWEDNTTAIRIQFEWNVQEEDLVGAYGGFFIDEVQPIFPRADLSYASESCSYTSPSIRFNLSVFNKGDAAAESTSKIFYYLSRNADLSDPVKIGETGVAALPPSTITRISYETDLTGYTGTYYVGFVLDSNDDVDEKDETNNMCIFDTPIDFGSQGGSAPDIDVDDTGVWFGRTDVGNTQNATINVSNTGDADLQINSVSIDASFADHDQFGIVNSIDSEIISPGNSVELTFHFSPTSSGYKTAKVDISSNDPDENPVNVYLYCNAEVPGNLIRNWDFWGTMEYWDLRVMGGAQATGSIEDREFHAAISTSGSNTWDVSLNQTNLLIENGASYTVSFDAYAAATRQIIPFVGKDSDPYTLYGSGEGITLSTSKTRYSFTFTMTEATDHAARLAIDMGTSDVDVYLDNVVLVKDSEGDGAQEPAGNMTINWDFSNGLNEWTFATSGTGSATGSVDNGEFHAQISNGGTTVRDVDLLQPNITLENGTSYTLSFKGRGEGSRTIGAQVVMSSSPFTIYNTNYVFSLTPSWQTFTCTFTMTSATDASARLRFVMGLSDVDVYLDEITLVANSATAVESDLSMVPEKCMLFQNYPNPFNPETTISYELSQVAEVTLTVYDLLGRKIRLLVAGVMPAGCHQAAWYGRNDSGNPVATGVYMYRLQVNTSAPGEQSFTRVRKMLFMK